MAVTPVQVAFRGFQYGLPVAWVYEGIERGLKEGIIRQPDYTLWPSGTPISVEYTREDVETWKQQYDGGVQVEIPREVWGEIDRALGVYGGIKEGQD